MKYIILVPILAILFIAQVYWADWIVKEIFHRDINNWMILISLFTIALFTPKALGGLTVFAMVVSTAYIWFLM